MTLFTLILNICWIVYFICAAGSAATQGENHLAIFGILTGILNGWMIYALSSGGLATWKFSITRKQLGILAITFLVVSCLFPPWTQTMNANGSEGFHSARPAGCVWLFSPPPPLEPGAACGVALDFSKLFLEWLIIGGVYTVAFLLMKPGIQEKAAADPNKPITLGDLAQFQREIKPFLKKPGEI